MCDLHLPFDKSAIQYQALGFAVDSIKKRSPDLIIFAGDAVCDGNKDNYNYFLDKFCNIDIPFLYIPGNSDLRDPNSISSVQKLASPALTAIGDTTIYALNDSDGIISEEQLHLIGNANGKSIVFMHHPFVALHPEYQKSMEAWRISHPDTLVFHAHMHVFERHGNTISLPALDPDKSIGEEPCILYFDTDSQNIEKDHFPCPIPNDFIDYLGVSCFRLSDIETAIKHKLKYLELRPGACKFDYSKLSELIEKWNAAGGIGLSIHLPDIEMKDGEPFSTPDYDQLINIGKSLNANRFTQHVPKISVEEADEKTLHAIADFICHKLDNFGTDLTIGIENMHMTAGEFPDSRRRYGYIPEECAHFAELLAKKIKHKVGINFDIGHARNNAPFSQKYQIATWMSMLGDQFVGYHIHQVTNNNGAFENHVAITSNYGSLISYASLFRLWQDGTVVKAPLILEMRPEGAYEVSLNTFYTSRCQV